VNVSDGGESGEQVGGELESVISSAG